MALSIFLLPGPAVVNTPGFLLSFDFIIEPAWIDQPIFIIMRLILRVLFGFPGISVLLRTVHLFLSQRASKGCTFASAKNLVTEGP